MQTPAVFGDGAGNGQKAIKNNGTGSILLINAMGSDDRMSGETIMPTRHAKVKDDFPNGRSGIIERNRNRRARVQPFAQSANIPNLFLRIAPILVFGYALVIPPFQVPDENHHLCRAWSVSELHFVGPQRTQVPTSFVDLLTRFSPRFEQIPERRVVSAGELVRWLRRPLRADATAGVENPNANVYSFVPYAATALVLGTGRALNASPLIQMYAARLVNGAIYVLLFFLSLRILPGFRVLLFIVALTPMAISQAASLSADSLTLGLTALFTALVFRLAFEHRLLHIHVRDGLPVVGVLILLSLCKFNPWLGLLALLIPAEKFPARWGRIAFAGLCAATACAVELIWSHANAAALLAFQAARAADGKLLAANAAFFSSHPLRFAEIAALTDVAGSWEWIREFVGVLGWVSVPIHPLLVILYTGGMIFAARKLCAEIAPSRYQKVILMLVVSLTVFSLNVLLWILETPTSMLHLAPFELELIRGIQGRYFLPMALPALVLVSRSRAQMPSWGLSAIIAIVVAVNAGGLLTVWSSYH
jgi:hypothetical protein